VKLHRLVLKNYRGIDHREIDFPDHGVVVVSGANEIGKSSMVEALDLLLESRDRSTKKEVKQVKPTHADVGSEVTAEMRWPACANWQPTRVPSSSWSPATSSRTISWRRR
jgi:recombinational DNA repair ATPase RecF